MSFLVVPKKRKYSDDTLPCIFCEIADNVVNNPKPDTYIIVQRAAYRRKDEAAIRFENLFNSSLDKQTFSWHRTCYASYTSEEKIRRREIQLHKQDENLQEVQLTEPSTSSTIYTPRRSTRNLENDSDLCIICGQLKKYKVKATYVLSDHDAAEKFLTVARLKMDDVFKKICTFDSVDCLLAQRVKYHKFCYKSYLYIPENSNNKGGRPSVKIPDDIVNKAFEDLLKEIEILLCNSTAYELSFLTKRLNSYIENQELSANNEITKDLLIKKYGEKNFMFSSSR